MRVTTVDVFAVEDRSVQLAWACLPSPGMTIEVAGQRVDVGPATAGLAYVERRPAAPGRCRRAGCGDDHRPRAGHHLRHLPQRARAGPERRSARPPPCRRRRGGCWPGSRPSATATSASAGSAPLRRFHDPRPRPPGLAAYPDPLCPGRHRRSRGVGRGAAGGQRRSDPGGRGRPRSMRWSSCCAPRRCRLR